MTGSRGFGMAAALVAVATIQAMPAVAQTPAGQRIDTPAGSLGETLRRIARQGGTRITFDERDVAGLESPAIAAADVPAAIGQALAGRPLAFRGSTAQGYVVAPADADGEIVVIARRDEAELDYLVRDADSSTRDGRSLREQPQSTTVISGALIQDQQIQTVAEALRNASGATVNLGNVQGPPSFTVRGFFVQPLSGGLRDPGALSQPVANVERVEVLKGPAALLGGADNLGGGVNIVTKRPIASPLLDLTAEYGSFDNIRLAVDASTALNAERTVSARIVGQYARADRNVAGYDGRFENLLATSLRFKNASLDLTVGAEMGDVRLPAPAYAAYAADGTLINFDDRPIGFSEQGSRTRNTRFYYAAEARPAEWLTLVSRSHYVETDLRLMFYAYGASPALNTAVFIKTDNEQRQRAIATDNYARFNFSTFGLNHRLIAGFNFLDNSSESFSPLVVRGGTVVGNPFSTTLPFQPFENPVRYTNGSTGRQYGYYVQDLIEIGPVHVVGALRQNEFVSLSQVGVAPQTRNEAEKLTFQGGAVLDLTRDLSFYANYMEGFQPTFLFDEAGDLLPPRDTRNIEGGAKWDLFGDRMALTGSVFRIRETNTPILVPGQRNVFTTTPGLESRGVELEAQGSITRSLNLSATYSYAQYEPISPTTTNRVVPGQPEHRYSLFTRYSVPRGPLRNLGIGVGLYGFSRSFLNQAGTFSIGAQKQVDLNLYYKMRGLTMNLGVTNLLDQDIYGVSRASTYIPLNPQRVFRLTLRYGFL